MKFFNKLMIFSALALFSFQSYSNNLDLSIAKMDDLTKFRGDDGVVLFNAIIDAIHESKNVREEPYYNDFFTELATNNAAFYDERINKVVKNSPEILHSFFTNEFGNYRCGTEHVSDEFGLNKTINSCSVLTTHLNQSIFEIGILNTSKSDLQDEQANDIAVFGKSLSDILIASLKNDAELVKFDNAQFELFTGSKECRSSGANTFIRTSQCQTSIILKSYRGLLTSKKFPGLYCPINTKSREEKIERCYIDFNNYIDIL